MNSMERIAAAIARQPVDRTPVIAQIFGHAAVIEGVPLPDYLQSGEVIAECQLKALRRYEHDAVFALAGVNVEAEAAGSVLKYRQDEYAVIERFALESIDQLDALQVPEPTEAGRMPQLLQAAHLLRQELGDRVPVIGGIVGPLTLATRLLGMEKTLYLAMDEPKRFEQLMDFATETLRRYGLALLEAGAHALIIFNPAASPAVVPPSFFREFEAPRLKILCQAFNQAGTLANWLHIAGPVDKILPFYTACGVDIGNLDYCVSPQTFLEMNLDLCVDGNIRPLDFVCEPPLNIQASAHALLKAFKNRPGFILSSGCEIPPETPAERVLAMTRAVLHENNWQQLPSILVIDGESHHKVHFQPDSNLREVLDTTDHRVHAACRGNGACGLCRVRLSQQEVASPTPTELMHLTEEDLADGIRLACQVIPVDNLCVEVVNPAPANGCRAMQDDEFFPVHSSSIALRRLPPQKYGIAVDLGTTHVNLSLWDLLPRERIAGCVAPNRQSRFGSDVLTRIMAATEKREQAQLIAALGRETIGELLQTIFKRSGRNPQESGRMLIAGNTAQLALLCEEHYDCLLKPEYWTRPLECRPADPASWLRQWNLNPQTELEVLQPLAGFVGSDLLAGVRATEMTESTRPSLLIDFGTNSEIALWDGRTLWVTSAAGGPAFEGCGLSCGMAALPGAVYACSPGSTSDQLTGHTITGTKARGICGSGMVDVVACLLNSGILTATGSFCNTADPQRFPFTVGSTQLQVTRRDIDLFQRAKAAIGTGVQSLLDAAGMKVPQLDRLLLAGAFGQFLNVSNAQCIGLLPHISTERVTLCGNSSLGGCETLLLNGDAAEAMRSLRENSRLINLSKSDTFEDLFLSNLHLRPMEGS